MGPFRQAVAAGVFTSLAAAGLGTVSTGGAVRAETTSSASADTPAWLTYRRPAEHGAAFSDVDVPVRDGAALKCQLARPAEPGSERPVGGRFPGLVMDFVAYKALHMTALRADAAFYAARGYNVVLCSPRGTGGSPGTWRPFTAQEQRDNYDIIEWLGTQPWSTGKVGQTGISYGGISSYRAAAAAPPHLVAVAPVVAYQDPYLDIVYPGGARGSVLRWWPLLTWAMATPGQDPAGAAGMAGAAAEWETGANAHPTRDAYWVERSVDPVALDRGDVPVLGIGGWHDLFPRGMVANYQAARDQSWLLMLPLTHAEFVPQTPFSPPELDTARLAWFDHWLHGLPDAPLPGARVTSRELPGREGRWVELADLPDRPASERLGFNFPVALGGQTRNGWTASFTVDHYDNSCACFDRGVGPPTPDSPVNDQRLADRDRLHFDGPALSEDWVILGSPVARLRAALSAPDGNLVVHLSSVAPDGTVTVITSGWLRASHVRSHEEPQPLQPDAMYDFNVELWPTHWRVPAGHHLRVSLSGADAATIQPDPTGARTVAVVLGAGGSWIDVPKGTTAK